jgi:hypothetical protein
MIAAQVSNMIATALSAFGGERSEPPEPLPLDAFVPYREHVDHDAEQMNASLESLESLRGL